MGDPFRTLKTALDAAPTQTYPLVMDLISALHQILQVQFGSETATGAAMTITTQGNPRCVLWYDETQECLAINMTGMAADSAFKIDNVAVSDAAADAITLGTNSFVVGVDADMNTVADTIFWVAFI